MSVVTKEPAKPAMRKTTAEHRAMADELLAVMNAIDEKMAKDRTEIEFLKTESARLQAENDAVLSRLKPMC